jgi:hypothetical protein
MRLNTGEFADLTNLKKKFLRDCYGRTGHDPKLRNSFFLAKVMAES